MSLELIVISLAVVAYLVGCRADERRSRIAGRRLRRLREDRTERPRMPMPSSP